MDSSITNVTEIGDEYLSVSEYLWNCSSEPKTSEICIESAHKLPYVSSFGKLTTSFIKKLIIWNEQFQVVLTCTKKGQHSNEASNFEAMPAMVMGWTRTCQFLN